jgi:hypothetical protein
LGECRTATRSSTSRPRAGALDLFCGEGHGIGNKAGLVNLGKTQMTSSCPEPTRRRIATSIAASAAGDTSAHPELARMPEQAGDSAGAEGIRRFGLTGVGARLTASAGSVVPRYAGDHVHSPIALSAAT